MDFLVPYIPLAIVLLFWLGFGMFYAKKVEKHKREVVEDHNRPPGHLTLVRQVDGTNYLRKLKVYLDGEPAGSISAGQIVHYPLHEGVHAITVKVDWCKTEPREFEIGATINTELICGSTYNDWKCIFMGFVDPRNYLYVRRAA